jgi:hypothetical protein
MGILFITDLDVQYFFGGMNVLCSLYNDKIEVIFRSGDIVRCIV